MLAIPISKLGIYHVNILRVENANPVYVAFVLNSLIGRMQTKQVVTGSAQAELYPGATSNSSFRLFREAVQDETVNNVITSFDKRQES